MRGSGGSPEPLGVDATSLAKLGADLLASSGEIPDPPAPFTTSGSDPISTKIMSIQPKLETPIQTGLPEVKAAAKKTADSIVSAAVKYEQTDEQMAQQIKQHTFGGSANDSAGGGTGAGAAGGGGSGGGATGGGGSGAGAGGSGSSTPAAAASAAAGASSPAAAASSGGGAMGQMSQLISMPMQMVGQSLGAVTSAPQSVMQGVESAVQQVTQATGGKDQKHDESALRPDESARDQTHHGAAPGQAGGERAPDTRRGGPAEVADRMNL